MENRSKIKKNILISLLIGTFLFLIFYLINVFVLNLIELKTLFDFVILYAVLVVMVTLLFFSIIYLLLAKDYFKDLKNR